jgi:hypothetical protein
MNDNCCEQVACYLSFFPLSVDDYITAHHKKQNKLCTRENKNFRSNQGGKTNITDAHLFRSLVRPM